MSWAPISDARTKLPVTATASALEAEGMMLAGLRVVDLASGLAGSAAALWRAEAGAEVSKIEAPGGRADRDAPPWSVLNRSKASAVVDLHTPDGRDRLQGLLATADVLIHDLAPAKAAAFGLADAELNERYPALIVSAIGGWPRRTADAG